MGTAVALATIVLPLLPQIAGDISALVQWIEGVKTAAQQSGEWSDAADAAYRTSILAAKAAPEQQPDAPA